MALDHEYSVLGGINRAKVGRWISLLAAAISSAIIFLLLTIVDVAQRFGLAANIPPIVLSLVSASTIFFVLYWIFCNFFWKVAPLARLLRVPNLAGEWACQGETLKEDGSTCYNWSGTVTISQNWDKIRVRLVSDTSGSNSVTAALLWDDIDGYRLLYSYRNDPKVGNPELSAHLGFADLIFSKDLQCADGEYFNGRGRVTFGKMKLDRR